MTSALELPGKLIPYSASLFLRATQELLKWQTPLLAASELITMLAIAVRTHILQSPGPSDRR